VGEGAAATRDPHAWALVLAGGQGRRMRHLTVTAAGISVPKQFCSVGRGPSLLHAALQRARAVAPPARIVVTVTENHRRWWRGLSRFVPAENIFIETAPRGTGVAILQPLFEILARDPQACVMVLPSDHFFGEERTLTQGLREAVRLARGLPREVLLLGFDPEECDPDLGYIMPRNGAVNRLRRVRSFVEKPGPEAAGALAAEGALLNSFIVVAKARALLRLFERRYPQVVRRLRRLGTLPRETGARRGRVTRLFRELPEIDFSMDVLAPEAQRLRVVRVTGCGWSDLGTPARLERALRHHGRKIAAIPEAPPRRRGAVDLAERIHSRA
jgi:mannose-1-phosphate guanylyltransferase